MYWIKVDKFGDMPIEKPFLLRDDHGMVCEGSTPFDYYDAEYWFPMPSLPMNGYITNDDWVSIALKDLSF